MNIGTVDLSKLRGVGDKFVGLAKETTGVLINNDRLQKAGEAQQEQATETLKALRDEAKAEAQGRKADAIEATQDSPTGSGILAEAKGKVKETVGDVTGNRDLQADGEADAKRGAADREATQAKVTAKAHTAKAKAAEKAEDSADKAS